MSLGHRRRLGRPAHPGVDCRGDGVVDAFAHLANAYQKVTET